MTENQVLKHYVKPYYEKQRFFIFPIDHARVPDVYMSKSDYVPFVLWMELKVVSGKGTTIRPEWRPGQLAWVEEQKRISGVNNVLVCIYLESKKECRVYSECKREYNEQDNHFVIRRQK